MQTTKQRRRGAAAASGMVCAGLLVLACHACSSFTEAPAGADVSLEGGGAPGSSCRALLGQDPALRGKNGVYEITSTSGAHRVYCDMTVDDGGWTLAGRSGTLVPGALPPFGWTSATGDVERSDRPYSLDVVGVGVPFDEVLVGNLQLTRAYKFAVGPTFLMQKNVSEKTGTVLVVAGDCDKPPTMLKNSGAISLTDVFFLRDVGGVDQHRGLGLTGFDFADYRNCDQGGMLHGAQGAIMVR